MKKQSAGLLLYRKKDQNIQILLAHPGGPFWKNKQKHAWSIPKGEFDDNEEPLKAAQREFAEETGYHIKGDFLSLGNVKQSNKIIHAWAIKKNLDADNIQSNTFEMEWPPNSGKKQKFPEIDRAAWFDLKSAQYYIHKGQKNLLKKLENHLNNS